MHPLTLGQAQAPCVEIVPDQANASPRHPFAVLASDELTF
eukprot:CAMPEP_0179053246 /NCGR_PEP_ID=MMETSP0796-20121207/22172_1 /TAXON_ID=73915 /ORGANISM="Pyrodinium bahamense, Strain pbaha01" /LENGTH=39 /DNA_ID= /DNA_START= /DNA_END= /DNA_ORIENTATION=